MSSYNSSSRDPVIKCLKRIIDVYFPVRCLEEILKSLECSTRGSRSELVSRLHYCLTHESTSRLAVRLAEEVARDLGLNLFAYFKLKMPHFGIRPSAIKPINPTMNKIVYLKNEQYLCKWTEIVNWNAYPLELRPSSNIQIKFKIGPDYADRIASTSDKSDVSIILRCCAIIDHEIQPLQQDDYPYDLDLYIGSTNCTNALPREFSIPCSAGKSRVSLPTILDDYLSKDIIKGAVEAKLTITFKTSYDLESGFEKRYAMAVILAEKRSIEEVKKEIVSRPKRSIEEFKVELRNFMHADKEILLEKATIALTSSFTFTRIKIPIRGINCHHLLIEDLKEYLELNRITEKWECVICKKPMRPEDIFIDQFYYNLLSTNETAPEVNLSKDGEITVTKCHDERPYEVISDGDDENIGDENVEAVFPKEEVLSDESLNYEVITIGDSSEDETDVTNASASDDSERPYLPSWFSNDGNSFNHHSNAQTSADSPPLMSAAAYISLMESPTSPILSASSSPQSIQDCNSAPQLSQPILHNPIQPAQTRAEMNTESGVSRRRFATKRVNSNRNEIECITLIDSSDDESNKSPPSKRRAKNVFTVDVIPSLNVLIKNGGAKSNLNDSVSMVIDPTDVVPIVSPSSMPHSISSMKSLSRKSLTDSHGLTRSVLMEIEENQPNCIVSQKNGIESDSSFKDKPEEQMDESHLILAYYLNKGKSGTPNFNTSRTYIDPEYDSITATIKAYELRLKNSLADE
uniref:SP-RING-type domain-containing protein n=1 Tax=Rhabditophanes sp. KR3021 TaxID=114890 RepID=A0AC35TP96_9BILA